MTDDKNKTDQSRAAENFKRKYGKDVGFEGPSLNQNNKPAGKTITEFSSWVDKTDFSHRHPLKR